MTNATYKEFYKQSQKVTQRNWKNNLNDICSINSFPKLDKVFNEFSDIMNLNLSKNI